MLSLPSESTAASSSTEEQQDEPYGVAWNEVTKFGSAGSGTRGEGGQRHDLVRTRAGYVAPGVVHHSQSAEDDTGLLEKYDTNGVRVFEETLGDEGYRLKGGSNLGDRYVGVDNADSDGWIVCVDT